MSLASEPAPVDGGPGPGPGSPASRDLVGGLFRRLFLDHWDAINREGAEERAALGDRFDPRPLWVLILASLVLVFEEYYGDRPTFGLVFPNFARDYQTIGEFGWWTGSKVVGYLIVPAIALKLAGFRLRDAGLRLAGTGRHLWIYVALFLAILPVIVLASYTKPFQHTYPFYKLAARSWFDLLAWEAMYGLSFLALEFFFRGFLLFGLRRTFGAYSIFVMTVPYCMIHFHKPVAEVTGAIFAGIILGTLAMRTRSIWCGVLIHVSVAWTMDLLALHHTTGFPGSGRFVG
ncbi:MAG: CPBP family intramembrane metalloprotease [Myxococcales bacterium]|nr:CPBP family intramembrane metalloprotease [Myxococcales bacterium]